MERAYEKYKAEDFLQDSFFLQWMKGEEQAAEFWTHWLKNHPEKRGEVQKARTLFAGLTFEEPEIPQSTREELWGKIATQTVDKGGRYRLHKRSRWMQIAGYAAMIVLLITAAVYFWPNTQMEYETRMAEIEEYKLPDRSKVMMNSNSFLSYQQTDSFRNISFKGEGFFNVKEGKAFRVESNTGIVTVLGTSFNIYDRQDKYEVICVSGKVKVAIKGNGEFILTKGEYVRQSSSGEVETNDDSPDTLTLDAELAWRNGEFFYKDTRLETVLNEVERQFDVDIHLKDDLKDISGAFYFKNDELDEAMQNILWPLRLTYTRENGDIYIKK